MNTFQDIRIDQASELPFYIQIAQQIKQLILDGALDEHSKLPPIRRLATALGVNNGTVVSAYNQLEIQDLVYSKPGSGTYVASRDMQDIPEEDVPSYALSLPDASEQMAVDFTGSAPEPDFFPLADYKALTDRILDREGGYAFGVGDAQGYLPLRRSLTQWLARRSIPAGPEHIHITSGSQQSLDIISKALIRRGDVVALESPVYPGALATISGRGAKILEIPLRADGLDLDMLEERAKRHQIRFLYTMPCFQNPTGITWTLRKKQQLLSLAKRYDFYVLEDDFLSEFSYGSKNIQTLKELDAGNQVIYIKSIAKLLMPGMRLGFIVAPPELSEQIRTNKYLADLSTAGLSQRVIDQYLRTRNWERAFKDMNAQYRARYQLLTDEVQRQFPSSVTYIPPQGGFNLWFTLPDGVPSTIVAQRAAKLGIRINAGHIYYMNQSPNRHFRIAFGKTAPPQIRSGIALLGNLLRVLC